MSVTRIKLPPRPRILVIALRRLGDVLLSTPLIRSIRKAWPDAHIDALIFADTTGILEGNPDLNGIITMPVSPTALQTLALARRCLRRYDLSVSTQTGDRPTAFAVLAGKSHISPVEDRFGGRLKRLMLRRSVMTDRSVHRVEEMLQIADVLGIERVPQVVPPAARSSDKSLDCDYAVIHAAPYFNYKRWNVEGWRAIAQALAARGLHVMATGGPSPTEREYLDLVWRDMPVTRCDGALSWGELTSLLSAARVYVGPDTSVTHLAAAAGCPTVALYGPTDPRRWGPWPAGGAEQSWVDVAPVQKRGNVWILQHRMPCVPCQLEGCERNLLSQSECLLQLGPAHAIAAADEALASNPATAIDLAI